MNRRVTTAVGIAALAAPISNAIAATQSATAPAAQPKKKVVTISKTISGPSVETDRWGLLQVTIVLRKTTTTIGTKKKVTRKVTSVEVPVYPNHTDRSVFINQQALPLLRQEALTAQLAGNINLVSGATDTSYAFTQSLQAAILQAKRV